MFGGWVPGGGGEGGPFFYCKKIPRLVFHIVSPLNSALRVNFRRVEVMYTLSSTSWGALGIGSLLSTVRLHSGRGKKKDTMVAGSNSQCE